MEACYRRHEREKCRAYEQRVREVERGSFTPLVFSISGGMGRAATVTYKRLASLLEKCRAYEQRVREVERGSFTPLVFSTSGGMGRAATVT